MKKLVTIVSAVMMLLMLAACAPTSSINPEQQVAIDDANTAYAIISAYANTLSDKTEFSLDEDVDVTTYPSLEDVVIKAGSTYSNKVDGTTEKTATITYEATVSWTVPAELESGTSIVKTPAVDKEVTVSFTGTATYDSAEDGGMTLKLGPWTIDGVAYEPAYCAALGTLKSAVI